MKPHSFPDQVYTLGVAFIRLKNIYISFTSCTLAEIKCEANDLIYCNDGRKILYLLTYYYILALSTVFLHDKYKILTDYIHNVTAQRHTLKWLLYYK